jgi:hypothetical protein
MPPSLVFAIVSRAGPPPIQEERTMDPVPLLEREVAESTIDEEALIQAWRAEQLRNLGLSDTLAETFAGLVEWHEVAALVALGCSPGLALEIAR